MSKSVKQSNSPQLHDVMELVKEADLDATGEAAKQLAIVLNMNNEAGILLVNEIRKLRSWIEQLQALILETPKQESTKGEDGGTPTTIELLELIEPLIPEPIKGEKGDKGDPGEKGLDGKDGVDGINGLDGVTPSREELQAIIQPLIPLAPEPVEAPIVEVPPPVPQLQPLGGFSAFNAPKHQKFTMDGVATTVTLDQGVSAEGTAIFVRYNGQMLDHTTHYTVNGNLVSFTFTPDADTIISVTYWW